MTFQTRIIYGFAYGLMVSLLSAAFGAPVWAVSMGGMITFLIIFAGNPEMFGS